MANSVIRQHKEIAMGKPVTGMKDGGSPARLGLKKGGKPSAAPKKSFRGTKRGS